MCKKRRFYGTFETFFRNCGIFYIDDSYCDYFDDELVHGNKKKAGVFAWNEGEDPEIKFSAVLSQGDIYIYDETGKLFRKVKTYEEFLTSDDKKLLSDGIDFYSEEEMLSFMNDFEG